MGLTITLFWTKIKEKIHYKLQKSPTIVAQYLKKKPKNYCGPKFKKRPKAKTDLKENHFLLVTVFISGFVKNQDSSKRND